MSVNNDKNKLDKETAKSFSAFTEELFAKALEGMREQLSPEELAEMKNNGEATIAEFKAENNID